ncbi:NADH-quinone oxidoreductase subunit J [Desulfoferrobacter suflitae]|uniref:NADH-quinone oxidoreductase subunit J n=1 Tax=Desulfoferrobacter suflitae TaxID=2865782 RepID=UPI00216445A0|nr:NADH-quinone oxidoreductase subunit J [Desulfoferrobacter suflitae]MCK8601775.1 NADH-quinone oxidoreductase subunit J [Desulfoferrobacter suflitae]
MQLLMFYLLGLGAVVAALIMVTNKRPVRAAMSLIATMSFLAGLYVLLDAHLIAALQLIVYAGAIMVLFLFVIMLLNIEEKEGRLAGSALLWQMIAIAVVGLVFVLMVSVVKLSDNVVPLGEAAALFGTTRAVGKMLFTEYLLPFEIASVLLLAAIVGAVILAKRRIDDSDQ